MRIIEVIPDVHAVDCDGVVWAYLLVERDHVTLVDTGLAESANLILSAVRHVGRAPSDVRQIILTHYHNDHIGSLAELIETTGASCAAHPLDAPIVAGVRPEDEPNISPVEMPFYEAALARTAVARRVNVDELVDEGDELEIMRKSVVVHVPGHTFGSIALYVPKRRLLLTGDAAAMFGDRLIVGAFNVSTTQARRSFRKLAELDFDVACFGHGEPLRAHAASAFRDLARRIGD